MADEAVIIELLGNKGDPVSFTVADGTAIIKGEIMTMTDPRTAIKSTSAGDIVAGIAAQDKVASDGQTQLALYTNAIFDLTITSGGTTTLGTYVRTGGTANQITVASTLDHETGKTVGKSWETGGNSEVIAVRVLL